MHRLIHIALISLLATLARPESALAAPDANSTAVRDLKPQTRQEPNDHYIQGVAFESSGRIDEAEKEYRKVLQSNPAHGDARRRLAEICLLRGDTAGAIEQFRAMVRYHENNPVVRYRLAKIYESNRNYRKATVEYQEAIRLAPQALPPHRGLAMLYRKRGMADKAITEYRKILAQDNDDASARREMIALYLKGKKFDELTEFLEQTVARKPEDPGAHYKLGVVYEFRKNYKGAAEEYGKAIELDKTHARAMNALARVYVKTDRVDEAKKLLEAAGQVDPKFRESALLLHNFNEEFKPAHSVKKRSKHGKGTKRKSERKSKKKSVKKSANKKEDKKKKRR